MCSRAQCLAAAHRYAVTKRSMRSSSSAKICVIRECVTINCGSSKDKGITTIGARGYFMAYSHVGHDCQVGEDVTFANGTQLAVIVRLATASLPAACRQYSSSAVSAVVRCWVVSVAPTQTSFPYGIATGLHAELGNLNLVGLKRRGISRENIDALRATFRLVFLEFRRFAGGSCAARGGTNGTLSRRSGRSLSSFSRRQSGRFVWRAGGAGRGGEG